MIRGGERGDPGPYRHALPIAVPDPARVAGDSIKPSVDFTDASLDLLESLRGAAVLKVRSRWGAQFLGRLLEREVHQSPDIACAATAVLVVREALPSRAASTPTCSPGPPVHASGAAGKTARRWRELGLPADAQADRLERVTPAPTSPPSGCGWPLARGCPKGARRLAGQAADAARQTLSVVEDGAGRHAAPGRDLAATPRRRCKVVQK